MRRALTMLAMAGLCSGCLRDNDPQPPTIIEIPAKSRPVGELLAEIGDHPIDPVVAQGRGLTLRRSDLLRLLVLQHGKSGLRDLVRREVAIQEIRRLDIEVDADSVTSAARRFLEDREQSLAAYLEQRGIDRTTFVNELSVRLGSEKLCRLDLARNGGWKLRIREIRGEETRKSENWYGAYMLDDVLLTKLRGGDDKVSLDYDDRKLRIEVLDRLPSNDGSGPQYAENDEKLATWSPNGHQLESFLDHLVSLQKIELITDRLYRELEPEKEGS